MTNATLAGSYNWQTPLRRGGVGGLGLCACHLEIHHDAVYLVDNRSIVVNSKDDRVDKDIVYRRHRPRLRLDRTS